MDKRLLSEVLSTIRTVSNIWKIRGSKGAILGVCQGRMKSRRFSAPAKDMSESPEIYMARKKEGAKGREGKRKMAF